MQEGFIIINKPAGITSHDVVDKLRKITGIKKIGHAGTLDPFATGILIIAISRSATKQISTFVKLDKEYLAEIHLGTTTDTYDKDGKITSKSDIKNISQDKIEKTLRQFTGNQKQIPPAYSAKKIKGKKMYELARAGIEFKRKAVDIQIYEINLLSYNFPKLNIKIKCSSGTYIRSIAFDIGEVLKCGAYLQNLKRTKIDKFNIEDAIQLSDITSKNWTNFLFQNNNF